MDKRKMGIICFLLCFFICLMPCMIQAASTADAKEFISTDKDCSFTLSYCSNGIAFSDLPVRLYQIADVSADFQYTLTPPFENSGLILNGVQTAGEWNVIRTTLETYILANMVEADFSAVTDREGQVRFESLTPGTLKSVGSTTQAA